MKSVRATSKFRDVEFLNLLVFLRKSWESAAYMVVREEAGCRESESWVVMDVMGSSEL